MNDRQIINAHFIHEETSVKYRELIGHAPRVGDEVRFPTDRYFTVTRLVWVYDEPESPYARLNIGIKDAA